MTRRTILLTGAAGQIGRVLTPALADDYDLRLTDVHRPADEAGRSFTLADLADLGLIEALCQGTDTVVHLAASSDLATSWEPLFRNNIIGCSNVFRAASEAGCRRVVFASSIHAGDGEAGQPSGSDRGEPRTLYGASKAWGEELARVVAHRGAMSVICLRIGWVMPGSDALIQLDNDRLDIILTHDDLVRLFRAAIEAPGEVRYGVFYGLSNNARNRYDLTETRQTLGYAPQDDTFAIARAREPGAPRSWVRAARRLARRTLRRG